MFRQLFNEPNEIKIISFYRYFSLSITSLVYLVGNFQKTITMKSIVVICLIISAFFLNYIYTRNSSLKGIVKSLVLMEIIANTLILIPTGGLKSPYIWYSLNTILVSVSLLNAYYCWINLFIYSLFSVCITYFTLGNKNMRLTFSLLKDSNLILSLILITLAAELLFELVKKLKVQRKELQNVNEQLMLMNKRINQSIQFTMDLYTAIYSLVNENDKNKLVSIVTSYILEATKSPATFFILQSYSSEWIMDIRCDLENDKVKLLEYVKEKWEEFKEMNSPIDIYIGNKKYLMSTVKSLHFEYGVIGIESVGDSEILYKEDVNQLRLLSVLVSLVLEKINLQQVNNGLIVFQEQNRIANEIHDNVCQRLFSVSCSTYSIKSRIHELSIEEIEKELKIINESTNKALKELRETIYDLSYRKYGENTFESNISSYLTEISKLNKVDVSFDISGNQELMGVDIKSAVYRIICEGVGNAVRHGKCSRIKIKLKSENKETELFIADNGIGFDVGRIKQNELGLGLTNMNNLVSFLQGKIYIESKSGKGTTIRAVMPNICNN